MERYIGLDVHAASTTAAVIDARGKRVGPPHVLETNGKVLVEFFKLQPGTLHVCLEEGTQSTWLAEILSPHVDELVVVHVSESRGLKDDARDAYALAERLRTGAIDTTVYKGQGDFATLRQLAKAHDMVVRDTTRAQNRLKALFRARGIPTAGKEVYAEAGREAWLAKLPDSSRSAAGVLFAQYDALREVRKRARRELAREARRHEPTRWIESCPGMGTVRVAQLLSIVVAPERFRTRQQLWSYAGLAIVTRSSSDWVKDGKGGWLRAKVQATRGLNVNCNRTLKQVFKGAAKTVIRQLPDSPLHKDYERMLASGIKPNLAEVTLARKIAAITLAMWKRKEVYDPAKYAKPSS
jgi:transposase